MTKVKQAWILPCGRVCIVCKYRGCILLPYACAIFALSVVSMYVSLVTNGEYDDTLYQLLGDQRRTIRLPVINFNVTSPADHLFVTLTSQTTVTTPVAMNATTWSLEAVDIALDNFNVTFMPYLRDYRNPCWITNVTKVDSYATSYYRTKESSHYKRYFSDRIKSNKLKMNHQRTQVKCLPLVYQIGFAKSGTTGLYESLIKHPLMVPGAYKEPHFWNKRHFQGLAHKSDGPRVTLKEYIDLYDGAGDTMEKTTAGNGSIYHPAVTIDASVYYAHEFTYWDLVPANRGLDEPKVFTAHYIRELVPGAKIIAIVREPVDRLYSDYNFFQSSYGRKVNPEQFHYACQKAVAEMKRCLQSHSLRHCAYNRELYGDKMDDKHEGKNLVDLGGGMYFPFLKDWMEVFPSDQVLVLRLEDFDQNTNKTINRAFDFLQLPRQRLNSSVAKVNKGRKHDAMLESTRQLMQEFYAPFNRLLAKLLNESAFDYSLGYTSPTHDNGTDYQGDGDGNGEEYNKTSEVEPRPNAVGGKDQQMPQALAPSDERLNKREPEGGKDLLVARPAGRAGKREALPKDRVAPVDPKKLLNNVMDVS